MGHHIFLMVKVAHGKHEVQHHRCRILWAG